MRFKYYLRGAGIGVILTTLIFTIAFAVYKPTLSDDEIMKKAEALGMEMPADDSDSADKKDTKLSDKANNILSNRFFCATTKQHAMWQNNRTTTFTRF